MLIQPFASVRSLTSNSELRLSYKIVHLYITVYSIKSRPNRSLEGALILTKLASILTLSILVDVVPMQFCLNPRSLFNLYIQKETYASLNLSLAYSL